MVSEVPIRIVQFEPQRAQGTLGSRTDGASKSKKMIKIRPVGAISTRNSSRQCNTVVLLFLRINSTPSAPVDRRSGFGGLFSDGIYVEFRRMHLNKVLV